LVSNLSDQLIHTTVRIETQGALGDGRGTGFYFMFCNSQDGHVPAIVSNKHVIQGAQAGKIHLTLRKPGTQEPDLGNHIAIPIDQFEGRWLPHPDPDVDLAVLPISALLQSLHAQGMNPHFIPLETSLIADAAYMNDLCAIEDIAMVGYPTGLWDSKHNLPIIRRGVTATAPYVDFDGKPLFMIDCACFPGSSGSPVLLYNVGTYMHKNGGTVVGQRVKLLGVLFAGPQFTATGQIVVEAVPTSMQPVAKSRIPTNLGLCVKAEELRWFERHFQLLLEAEKALKEANAIGPAASGQ
jgi:hypothetical protein